MGRVTRRGGNAQLSQNEAKKGVRPMQCHAGARLIGVSALFEREREGVKHVFVCRQQNSARVEVS